MISKLAGLYRNCPYNPSFGFASAAGFYGPLFPFLAIVVYHRIMRL